MNCFQFAFKFNLRRYTTAWIDADQAASSSMTMAAAFSAGAYTRPHFSSA
jgi:hypothetical protein